MKALTITEVETELTEIPFLPNYTVVAINATATQEVLQSADESGGSFETIATVPAGSAVVVGLNKPFVKLADAGFLILLSN